MHGAAEHQVRFYIRVFDITFLSSISKRAVETVKEYQNGARAKEKAVLTTIWLLFTHIGFPNEIITRIVREICVYNDYIAWNAAWYRHEQQLLTTERRKAKPDLQEYKQQKMKWMRKKW